MGPCDWIHLQVTGNKREGYWAHGLEDVDPCNETHISIKPTQWMILSS